MNRWTAGISALVLGWSVASAGAGPVTLGLPVVTDDEPTASLGTPVAVPGTRTAADVLPAVYLAPVVRGQSADSPSRTDPRRPKPSDDPLVGGAVPEELYRLAPRTGPTLVQTSAEEKYNSGAVADPPSPTFRDPLDPPPPDRRDPPLTKIEKSVSRSWGSNAWDQVTSPCDPEGGEHTRFQSDHAFDGFISPLTSPFTAEDPRSLTEVRPIFLYQKIPGNQPYYQGGTIYYYGLQGRLAITENWSVVLNKFGGMTISPGGNSTVGSDSGFTEIWIGPKWTFYRCEDTCTVAAAGLTFQIPVGSSGIFQHTGNLSLAPYLTAAQSFGRTSWGTFNVLDTLSYSFATNGARNSYFANNLHLDYDVANLHRVYPLMELNWYYYTTNGAGPNTGVAGLDLMNTGSPTANGYDFFSLAFGMRYKFSEHTQLGLAAEFPLVSNKDIFDYRITFDIIFRY